MFAQIILIILTRICLWRVNFSMPISKSTSVAKFPFTFLRYLKIDLSRDWTEAPCIIVSWVFHDRPIWRISVRLSDSSEVTQNKINLVKNCPQWGLNSQPPDHQFYALPAELARNLKWAFFCFMHQFTCWTLFISRINRAWLYKGLVDWLPQPNSDLAQLAEHGTDELEVLSSNPIGGNFWRIYFVLCNFKYVR